MKIFGLEMKRINEVKPGGLRRVYMIVIAPIILVVFILLVFLDVIGAIIASIKALGEELIWERLQR